MKIYSGLFIAIFLLITGTVCAHNGIVHESMNGTHHQGNALGMIINIILPFGAIGGSLIGLVYHKRKEKKEQREQQVV
jgi:hypothetical protein